MGAEFALAMAGAASAHQAATATLGDTSQEKAGRRRRSSADLQRAQQGGTATAAAAPAALDNLSRIQRLANASPQVAQLRRLQALADNHYAPLSQLAGDPEEEKLVQGKFAAAGRQQQLQQVPRANYTGLPDQLKSGIESLSGLSMDHVRVHYNSAQPAQLDALAYAQGSDIHLAPGQEQHLPHEAWHVAQQAQGRVRPTLQLKEGVQVNDDVGLEHEADVMGEKALALTAQLAGQPEGEERLQCKFAPVLRAYAESNQGSREKKTGLPDNLKTGIESLSGMSLDNVKVHYNSAQPDQINALAYVQGNDIHVSSGQDQHLPLPHKAWHTVQQAQCRVQPTVQMKGNAPTPLVQRVVTINGRPVGGNERAKLINQMGIKDHDIESQMIIDAAISTDQSYTLEDVKSMLPDPAYRPPGHHETSLDYEDKVAGHRPLGFASADDFQLFIHKTYSKLPDPDATIVFHGSSLTGMSFKDKGVGSRFFDVGRDSDFDVAIVSEKLFKFARENGVKIRGDHSEPLQPAQLELLGLGAAHYEAVFHARREVNFMLYETEEQAQQHEGPSLVIYNHYIKNQEIGYQGIYGHLRAHYRDLRKT